MIQSENKEKNLVEGSVSRRHWSGGWVGALLAFVLPLLLIAYFLGVFARPQVQVTETGPYRYAYLPFQGPYYLVNDNLQKLKKTLVLGRVPHGAALGVFYDDPRSVPEKARRARAGFILPMDAQVPAGVASDVIPRRRVVMVQVEAHPAIAPIKTYRALDEWLKTQGVAMHWPTLERYGPGQVVTLEMPF